MKKRFTLILMAAMCLPTATFADFVVNNIKYAPISDTEVRVTGGTISGSSLVIPETVYDEDEDLDYTVTEIGDNAFALFGADGARITGNVTLPKTVRRIGAGAFNYQSFTAINLPEGLTYIGEKAFEVNRNLHTVVMPSTLKEIGTEAFSRSGLSYVYMLGDTPCTLGDDIFLDVSGEDENLKSVGFHIVVKASRLADYTSAWNCYADALTDKVPLTTSGELPVYAPFSAKPSTGVTTYCSPMALDLSAAEGLTVYYVEAVAGNTVKAVSLPGSVLPAGEGVILNGEKDKTYYARIADDQTAQLGVNNFLKGTLARMSLAATDGDSKNYVLCDTDFTLFSDADPWRRYIRQNTAYLPVKADLAPADTLALTLNGVATAVKRVNTFGCEARELYHTLDGRAAATPSHGIFICKNRKVVAR